MEPQWLNWAKRLQAIAQNGLTFSEDKPFDLERYEAIRQIAAEMMATAAQTELQPVLDLFTGEIGYATPKVDVRAAVFRDGAILLVKEQSDGLWTLPGGWADVSESPSENITREVYEEAGFRVRVAKLAAVYDRSRHPHRPPFPHHVYKLFFLCDIVDGTATPGVETSEVGFFAEKAIPPLSINRVTPAQVARMFEHYRRPDLSADFD